MGKFYIDEGVPRIEIKEVEKLVEVIKEVPVEVIREVMVEVLKEVPVEIIKEISVEVIKEVFVDVVREVPVEVLKEIEVIKEVPVEVIKVVHDFELLLKERQNVSSLKQKIKLYQIALAVMIFISIIVGVI